MLGLHLPEPGVLKLWFACKHFANKDNIHNIESENRPFFLVTCSSCVLNLETYFRCHPQGSPCTGWGQRWELITWNRHAICSKGKTLNTGIEDSWWSRLYTWVSQLLIWGQMGFGLGILGTLPLEACLMIRVYEKIPNLKSA